MRQLKGKWLKFTLFALPSIFLAFGAARIPFPVPAILLPERVYLVLDTPSLAAPARTTLVKRFPSALAPGPRGIVPFLSIMDNAEPDRLPSLPAVFDDIARLSVRLERIRIVCSFVPTQEETRRIQELQRLSGKPIAVEQFDARDPRPVLSAGFSISSAELGSHVNIFMGSDILAYERLSISQRGKQALETNTDALPPDRLVRLPIDPEGIPFIDIHTTGKNGDYSMEIPIPLGKPDDPRVLVVSDRPDGPGFIESLYPSRRITRAALKNENPQAYELIVLDGEPLEAISPQESEALRDAFQLGTSSLVFVADSPEFGGSGDNPILESLLPVSLIPRSLKKLPDMAVLILIDRSGSMFGNKLSLAKVTGVELIANLKPSDSVGIALFSDSLEWLRDFAPGAQSEAPQTIEPVFSAGGTDLFTSLSSGIKAILKVPIDERHIIIVSDGITKPGDFAALAEKSRESGISISTMAIGDDIDRTELYRLSRGTGGNFYRVNNIDEIPGLVFEDRIRIARTVFTREKTPIKALDGRIVATIDAMCRFTPRENVGVLFANEFGDPLLSSRESGERAVLLFASDQHGAYTKDFFSSTVAVGIMKRRLDALFDDRAVSMKIVMHSRGASIVVRGEGLLDPRLLVSQAATLSRIYPMEAGLPGNFSADIPDSGDYSVAVMDRGAVAARFPLSVRPGYSGILSGSRRAADDHAASSFLLIFDNRIWIYLFFASLIGLTVFMRSLD